MTCPPTMEFITNTVPCRLPICTIPAVPHARCAVNTRTHTAPTPQSPLYPALSAPTHTVSIKEAPPAHAPHLSYTIHSDLEHCLCGAPLHIIIHCVSSRVDVPMLAAVPVPVHRGELHGPADQALGADAAACAGVAVVGVTDVAGAGVRAVQLKHQALQLWADPTCVATAADRHTPQNLQSFA